MTPERWQAVDSRLRTAWERLRASAKRRFHETDPELVALMQRAFLRCGPTYVQYASWFGGGGQQFPADYIAYQEVLWASAPQVLIETGTGSGGTTLFFEECLSRRHPSGDYKIITIDTLSPAHHIVGRPKITGLVGSSIDIQMAEQIRSLIPPGLPVAVTLDSDHDARHVLSELELYAPLVTPGQYLIVQDTFFGLFFGGNLNGEQAGAAAKSGNSRAFDYIGTPLGAVEAWLEVHGDEWEVDESPTRFLLTQNPYGYLRRRE